MEQLVKPFYSLCSNNPYAMANTQSSFTGHSITHNENEGSFDFAFVDADKVNYLNYHERLMKLVKVGGIVVYDNTLWGGSVAMPEESVPEGMKHGRHFTIELNKSLASDPRILMSHAPLGDGITICKRIQ
ncbi:probable caffeoyl-CoA O-methyltransferase At4g26220 [Camellia sinensis]|uniref:probable caffeoyl-CoA O-methyltransferase At4g26220 n=1 Tax=Camellia sinensis TaxID=4442 RepID=UPI0010356B4F|nr:probable caffeoyl-CoA O-methyltransferase At4g26220 [Camellia sinensis]